MTKENKKEECDIWKCKHCNDEFTANIDMMRHLKAMHRRHSECKQCHKKFVTSSLLEHHMKDEHGTIQKYQCDECGKTFHFKWRLENHTKMHNIETKDKIRKCHYFNNKKNCPFEMLGCKFRHEESTNCKYNDKCKFDKCQFRH